jgi:hypothetical protein
MCPRRNVPSVIVTVSAMAKAGIRINKALRMGV